MLYLINVDVISFISHIIHVRFNDSTLNFCVNASNPVSSFYTEGRDPGTTDEIKSDIRVVSFLTFSVSIYRYKVKSSC